MVFYLFLCCLLGVLWLFENMILNDLRFDFHGHFEERKSEIKSPYFNMILKNLKIVLK
jgi:hypothetical protein